MKLKDRITIVTGASSGLGRSIALEFAKEGAKVVAMARRKERLDELVKEAPAGSMFPYQGDVSSREEILGLFEYVKKTFGKLDVLVNNAGILDNVLMAADMDDDTWDRIIAVNLTGPFLMSREALKMMVAQGSGNIVNMASVGGITGCHGGTAYTATKHGVVGLTRNIAWAYLKKGIRCNAICPGTVESEIMADPSKVDKFGMERMMEYMPLLPSGKPEQIAKIAAFLASDDANMVNGAIVVADKGMTSF